MPITNQTPSTSPPRGIRRRTRQQRRNLRSGAFDLLAVLAAVALVLLGLVNLYLIDAVELAARQAMIAVGGVLVLALFLRPVKPRSLQPAAAPGSSAAA